MMGDRQVMQEALFYDVSIERLVPEDHLLRVIDRYLDLEGIREELKPKCCPSLPHRKVPRSVHENARDVARRITATDAYDTSRRERKKVEMLFAHLKRILKLDRLRLRGPNGINDEFLLAATAQNLRKLAKLANQGIIPAPA